jgi:F-type H+-transporting ATPase subunit delta
MAELSTLARPYAKGLYAVAKEKSALDAWSEKLALLAALVGDKRVFASLASPALTAADQVTVFAKLCGETLGTEATNFLSVLAENRRIALLPQIFEQYQLLKAAQDKTIDVEVVSAFPIDGTTEQTLADKLSKKLDRKVKISTRVDETLLGGVLIKAGDMVIDGSVRGRLNKLAEAMNL